MGKGPAAEAMDAPQLERVLFNTDDGEDDYFCPFASSGAPVE
jgi:hypothetical protein